MKSLRNVKRVELVMIPLLVVCDSECVQVCGGCEDGERWVVRECERDERGD